MQESSVVCIPQVLFGGLFWFLVYISARDKFRPPEFPRWVVCEYPPGSLHPEAQKKSKKDMGLS